MFQPCNTPTPHHHRRLRSRGYLFDATRLFNEKGEAMAPGPLAGGGWKHEESIKVWGALCARAQ